MSKEKKFRRTREENLKRTAEHIAEELAEEAGEGLVKKAIGKKGLAKFAAKATGVVAKIAKAGLIAKVAVVAVCAIVAVGIVYYGYTQLSNHFGNNTENGGNSVAVQTQSQTPSEAPIQTGTPSETPTETPSDTPSDPVNTGDNAPAAPSDSVISGTYIDDFSGSLIFTFTGDTVTMDFDGWVIEGTFTAENGVLFIDTSEPSMFSHRDIPFTVEGDGDAFIIDGGNKFTRQ